MRPFSPLAVSRGTHMLGVSSNIISRPLTTVGYHSPVVKGGGRRAPQTRVRAARARHSRRGPQNTHTRHRTEQAAKATRRVPTRVHSTGTQVLRLTRRTLLSVLFLYAPALCALRPRWGCSSLSPLQPARLLSAHVISSSCTVMPLRCHVTLASP